MLFSEFAFCYVGLKIPELPAGDGLEVKHLQTVLDRSTLRSAFLHEECVLGIIDAVEEEVLRSEKLVGNGRGGIHLGEHADGRAVDDDGVFPHHFGREVGVIQWGKGQGARGKRIVGAGSILLLLAPCSLPSVSAHISPLYSQTLQPDANGFACAAGAQDEGFLVPGLQERLDALHEADDVAVETLKMN